MRRLVMRSIVIVASLVSGAGARAQDASAGQTVVQRLGQLAVKGNRIVDQHGRPVVLRGMSLFWSQWGGQYYNAQCVKWLKEDWQCTVVRAAVGIGSGGYLKNSEQE